MRETFIMKRLSLLMPDSTETFSPLAADRHAC